MFLKLLWQGKEGGVTLLLLVPGRDNNPGFLLSLCWHLTAGQGGEDYFLTAPLTTVGGGLSACGVVTGVLTLHLVSSDTTQCWRWRNTVRLPVEVEVLAPCDRQCPCRRPLSLVTGSLFSLLCCHPGRRSRPLITSCQGRKSSSPLRP